VIAAIVQGPKMSKSVRSFLPLEGTRVSRGWAMAAVAMLMCVVCASACADAGSEIDDAVRAESRGDLDEAIRLLNHVLEGPDLSDHQRALAYTDRGAAFLRKKVLDRAVADFDEAIKLDPKIPGLYSNRAGAWMLQKNYERAILDLDEALRLDPQSAAVFRMRASVWSEQKNYDRAKADLDEVIRLNPHDPLAFRERGFMRFLLGNYAAASDDFAEEIKQKFELYGPVWLYLMRTRAGLPAKMQATGDSQAAELKTWPGPLIALFMGSISEEDVLAATSDLDAKKARDQLCEAHFYLGEWHLGRGEKDKASSLLGKAMNECPQTFIESRGAAVEVARLAK
jgi:lipoprotein NlpI